MENKIQLEFKKPKLRLGDEFELGYYFKNEFLSRYKQEALKILRGRIKDLSNEERDKTDEWKVIHAEFLKSCEATDKCRRTKQPYFKRLNRRTIERRIIRLKQKIEDIEERKKDLIEEQNKRIELVKNQIKELKGGIERFK
jgi:hypothetical protein